MHVVGIRSEEQMFNVDAWWIVAPMQDIHAIWDRSVRFFPCHAVCSSCSTSAVTAEFRERALPDDAWCGLWCWWWVIRWVSHFVSGHMNHMMMMTTEMTVIAVSQRNS